MENQEGFSFTNELKILNELYKKCKKNHKLSQVDKEVVKKNLVNLLKEQPIRETIIDFAINFPDDIGIAAYMEYYKTLDFDNQKELNESFVCSTEFLANSSFKSINRATALIRCMYEEDQNNFTGFILKNACKLIADGYSKNISSRVIEIFRKNILSDSSECLFNIQLSDFDDKNYYHIERVIVNCVFKPLNGEVLSPKIQYRVLDWFLKSGREIVFTGDEREIIQNALNHWPDQIKEMLCEDMNFKYAYRDSINFNEIMNEKNQCNGLTKDSNNGSKVNFKNNKAEEINVRNQSDQGINQIEGTVDKSIGIKAMLQQIIKEVTRLENKLITKEEEVLDFKEALKTTQKQYEQKFLENEKLNQVNYRYEEEISRQKSEIDLVKNQIKFYEEEMKKVTASKNEYRSKVETLLDMDSREESNALREFKNKLAGKLKYHYLDFKQIENYVMNDDLGENLRIQIKEIFDILKNEGIVL